MCYNVLKITYRFRSINAIPILQEFYQEHQYLCENTPQEKNWVGAYVDRAEYTPHKLKYYFETDWRPPIDWVKKTAEKYPSLVFSLHYCEPGAFGIGEIFKTNLLCTHTHYATVEDWINGNYHQIMKPCLKIVYVYIHANRINLTGEFLKTLQDTTPDDDFGEAVLPLVVEFLSTRMSRFIADVLGWYIYKYIISQFVNFMVEFQIKMKHMYESHIVYKNYRIEKINQSIVNFA